MNPPHTLSIIMPVYNARNTISRSVSSFLLLSEKLLHDHNIKSNLYIIDDCSTDNTAQLARDFAQMHYHISLIENRENLGPGLSRNKALSLVESEYVGFLDADDEIIADAYIDSYLQGVKLGADWITFNGWFCSNFAKKEKYDFDRLIDDDDILSSRCRRGELDGSVIFSIYSSKMITCNNLRFPSGYYEDISFAYRAMLISQKRCISDKFSYKKHSVDTSIVNTVSERHVNGLIDAWLRVDSMLGDCQTPTCQYDRVYGVYGYVANLISSIVLSDNSAQYKMQLFSLLFERVVFGLKLQEFNYIAKTKKDKLVAYFMGSFVKRKSTFVVDMDSFYRRLFD